MRVRVCAAMTALVCLMMLAPAPAHAARGWRWKECRFQELDGRWGWTVTETQLTIRCLAPKLGVSTEMALTVAEHESGFQANPSNDSHCGVYQHMRGYFDGRLDAAEGRWPWLAWVEQRCESARSNVLAAFYLVKTDGWYAHWCRWAVYC